MGPRRGSGCSGFPHGAARKRGAGGLDIHAQASNSRTPTPVDCSSCRDQMTDKRCFRQLIIVDKRTHECLGLVPTRRSQSGRPNAFAEKMSVQSQLQAFEAFSQTRLVARASVSLLKKLRSRFQHGGRCLVSPGGLGAIGDRGRRRCAVAHVFGASARLDQKAFMPCRQCTRRRLRLVFEMDAGMAALAGFGHEIEQLVGREVVP